MYRKNPIINDRADRQVVKNVSEHGPDARVSILLLALQLESIDCRDLSSLVVAANKANAVRVPQLEQEQQRDGLDRVRAAVDVVAQE